MAKSSVSVAARLQENIGRVFVGKSEQISLMTIGFLSGLHVLIEDIPGVGKTTLARSLAQSVGLDFGRIQFTPDLLPGDIVGMTIWQQEKRDFTYKQGAIMHQFILADEINRASPRTQSSLLEAMGEGSVTVDGVTYQLPRPFFVIATQNPVNFLGAFPLPEAQVDRFGISFSLGYPSEQSEVEILSRFQANNPLDKLTAACTPEEIIEARVQVRQVRVDEKIKRYMVELTSSSRRDPQIKLGLSPRATQHLLLATQTQAFVQGRDYAIPEDVLSVAEGVLSHRLILAAEAKMENKTSNDMIRAIRDRVPIPTGLAH